MSAAALTLVIELLAAAGTIAGAVFAARAAVAARDAAKDASAQAKRSEAFQRESLIDQQWMTYQNFYAACINLFDRHPGMPLVAYLALDGDDQRKINIAANALMQTLDLAYRANDPRQVGFRELVEKSYSSPIATGYIPKNTVLHECARADYDEIQKARAAELEHAEEAATLAAVFGHE